MTAKNVCSLNLCVDVDLDKKICPECKSKHIIKNKKRGELFCEECGLVLKDEIIDSAARQFAVGPPTTSMIFDKGLSTIIYLPLEKRTRFHKLKKLDDRIRKTYKPEYGNLGFGIAEIKRMASILGLKDNIKERAALLYKMTKTRQPGGVLRGYKTEVIVSAIIYIVCKEYGTPRTLNEMASVTGIKTKMIGKIVNLFLKRMEFKLSPTLPHEYLPGFCSKLDFSQEIQSRAMKIIEESQKTGRIDDLIGRNPIGVAAAALWLALCNSPDKRKDQTQRQIVRVSGVSDVTVRKITKILKKYLHEQK